MVFVMLGVKGVWNGIRKAKYDVEFLLFTLLFEVRYWYDRFCGDVVLSIFVGVISSCRFHHLSDLDLCHKTREEMSCSQTSSATTPHK